MNYYLSIFNPSGMLHLFHQPNGKVMHALFQIKGQKFMAIDNMNKEDHPFTHAVSLFVECDTEEEIHTCFEMLSTGGNVMMPLATTPVSKKFGWVQDKFGVSWQLNLRKN